MKLLSSPPPLPAPSFGCFKQNNEINMNISFELIKLTAEGPGFLSQQAPGIFQVQISYFVSAL